MRHILGMAKSNLDASGAKGPKLEFDFLRLAYTVQALRRRGDDAQGYLLVLAPLLVSRIEVWVRKYETRDDVRCLCHALAPEEAARLALEKQANVAGMLAGAQGSTVEGRSSATVGQALGEAALHALVRDTEPGLVLVTDRARQPLGVQWDLYGVVPTPVATRPTER